MLDGLPKNWPAIVIGAGPAGSSAAITMARMGLQVLLVDSKSFPRRKVCGGCLNQVSARLLQQLLAPSTSTDSAPDSVEVSDTVKVRSATAGGHAVRLDTSIHLKSFELTHYSRKSRFPMPQGMAVDRFEMDQALVDAAKAAGVTFLAPATAKVGCIDSGGRRSVRIDAAGQAMQLSAGVVIVACGLGNRNAFDKEATDLGELLQTATRASRVGVESILDEPLSNYDTGCIHMVVARHGYVGLTRVANNRLHVAAAVDRAALQRLGPREVVESILFEAGATKLQSAAAAQWRGTPPLTARATRLAAERVFLVGDAAGYVEPFTGEGIRWALESGVAVAPFARRAHNAWAPALIDEWEDWYQNVIAVEQRLCRQITSGLKRPLLRRIAHYALWLRPRFASTVIARLNSESNS